MKHRNFSWRRKQQGAVLIISLLIMLIMSLIGVTSMQVTGLEEKMANNSQDLNLALQAAEVAVREGEAYIDSLITIAAFDGSSATYIGVADEDPDYMDSSVWSSGVTYSGSLPGVASQPRYLIKMVTEEDPDTNAGLNVGGYGDVVDGGSVTIFRVTGRGTGGTDSSVVILQSNFGKRF